MVFALFCMVNYLDIWESFFRFYLGLVHLFISPKACPLLMADAGRNICTQFTQPMVNRFDAQAVDWLPKTASILFPQLISLQCDTWSKKGGHH